MSVLRACCRTLDISNSAALLFSDLDLLIDYLGTRLSATTRKYHCSQCSCSAGAPIRTNIPGLRVVQRQSRGWKRRRWWRWIWRCQGALQTSKNLPYQDLCTRWDGTLQQFSIVPGRTRMGTKLRALHTSVPVACSDRCCCCWCRQRLCKSKCWVHLLYTSHCWTGLGPSMFISGPTSC